MRLYEILHRDCGKPMRERDEGRSERPPESRAASVRLLKDLSMWENRVATSCSTAWGNCSGRWLAAHLASTRTLPSRSSKNVGSQLANSTWLVLGS